MKPLSSLYGVSTNLLVIGVISLLLLTLVITIIPILTLYLTNSTIQTELSRSGKR